jgi:hypothetical protein
MEFSHASCLSHPICIDPRGSGLALICVLWAFLTAIFFVLLDLVWLSYECGIARGKRQEQRIKEAQAQNIEGKGQLREPHEFLPVKSLSKRTAKRQMPCYQPCIRAVTAKSGPSSPHRGFWSRKTISCHPKLASRRYIYHYFQNIRFTVLGNELTYSAGILILERAHGSGKVAPGPEEA